MPVTQIEIDSFHRFASEKLLNGDSDGTIDDLFQLWRLQNPTPTEQADIHAAIERGLADVEAGRDHPAGATMNELRVKHGIPAE